MTKLANQLNIGRADWWAVAIYLVLIVAGWVNIYSVLQEGAAGIFDFSAGHGRQMVWIGVSLFCAVAILLIDDKYYHIFAYPAYWASILLLLAVLVVGREVNGARAWIFIGGQGIQPGEFAKFTTALALARLMSRYNYNPRRLRDMIMSFGVVMLPAMIIIVQQDMGSAMVYAAFLVVFFREGMSGWIFAVVVATVVLFVCALVLSPFATLAGSVVACIAAEGMANGRWRRKLSFLAALALGSMAIYFGAELMGRHVSLYAALLVSTLVGVFPAIAYGYRHKLPNVRKYILMCMFCVVFVPCVDFIFDHVLEPHQQVRILDTLGLERDVANVGYQTNQSKIAIGSGGWLGKGYMEGTQTRFSFVPEQSTDYIVCTVGEEWGFAGSVVVVGLLFALVFRLMRMAERQAEAFNRVYIYSVAAIFLFHIIVNIGMTLGIMPVIGIPLPLFSYGGSSLLAFSILFFVAVKLGTTKRE
jgi:rod shape determining protein RodA